MKMLFSWMGSLLLIHCFTVCTCRGITVYGIDGQDVILPCKYDSRHHGKCEICWMRGVIPSSGCGSEIIATDGDKVVRNILNRYQLPGDIQNGDVSLKIHSTKQSDSGTYGCRVHVPGWFNDEKYEVYLVIEQKPVSTASVNITDITTMGPWNHSETLQENETITALPDHSKNVDETMDEMLACIVASILLFLLILWTAALYIMWKQKRKRRTVEMHQNIQDAIIYSNTDSSLGFHNRVMAVDNIYQLETENEYERWS